MGERLVMSSYVRCAACGALLAIAIGVLPDKWPVENDWSLAVRTHRDETGHGFYRVEVYAELADDGEAGGDG